MKKSKQPLEPVEEKFSGETSSFEEAAYTVFGVPYDKTSTYRLGSKLAPEAIRKASLNIETYSFRAGLDLADFKICDLGNINVLGSIEKMQGRISKVVSYVLEADKVPIILGGEHTLTSGAIDALPTDAAIILFDAHFDLRDEYLGKKVSHATFMRRIVEKIGSDRIFYVGSRAVCSEELRFIDSNKIHYITSRQAIYDGWHKTTKTVRDFVHLFPHFYISLDMDVLDPAHAPGVGNPEPEGMDIVLLLDILQGICDERLIGFDLVEVAPNYDSGTTAVQAAKIIHELICFKEGRKELLKKSVEKE
ncbi:MAG: agmatinase [Candidatus Bathyarchaeota archaeon]